MKSKFAMLSRFQQIVMVVFSVHVFVVSVLCVHHFLIRSKPKTKMVVRTVSATPSVRAQTIVSADPQAKSGKKSVASTPKKEKSKEAVSPKAVSVTAKPKPSQSVHLIDPSIVTQMESQLVEFERDVAASSTLSKASSLVLPKDVPDAYRQEACEIGEMSYGEKIIGFLQNALELPEFGEVKVDLELHCSGRILRAEIIETKSKKNGEFLKKRLLELDLPCLNDDKKSNEVHKFTITFKNLDPPASRSL